MMIVGKVGDKFIILSEEAEWTDTLRLISRQQVRKRGIQPRSHEIKSFVIAQRKNRRCITEFYSRLRNDRHSVDFVAASQDKPILTQTLAQFAHVRFLSP